MTPKYIAKIAYKDEFGSVVTLRAPTYNIDSGICPASYDTLGIVKLSDEIDSTLDSITGQTAATPLAVSKVHAIAQEALDKANNCTGGGKYKDQIEFIGDISQADGFQKKIFVIMENFQPHEEPQLAKLGSSGVYVKPTHSTLDKSNSDSSSENDFYDQIEFITNISQADGFKKKVFVIVSNSADNI